MKASIQVQGFAYSSALVCCLLLLFLIGGSAWPQEIEDPRTIVELPSGGKLSAKVYVGFDSKAPYRRDMTWVPVTVELDNGQESIKGDLVLNLKEGQEIYRVPIELSAGARKSYSMFVFIPQLFDELEFRINMGRHSIQMESVTVSTALLENQRFMAILSNEHGSHNFMEDFRSDDVVMPLNVLYTTPSILPRSWVGYQNIDALLWDQGSVSSLSPAQEEALDHWIQMGGTLILAAGGNWQELGGSSFRLYSPVTMNGSRVIEAGTEVFSPEDSSHAALRSSLVAATGELMQDPTIKILLEANSMPLLVEKKWGAGRIYWSALSLSDPIFRNPSYQETFVDTIARGTSLNTTFLIGQMDRSVMDYLRWIVQAELPSTWFIAMYLGLYIFIVVPLNYIIFRWVGRLEWAWLTVPIWAILFAYGAYYIGALRQQGYVSVQEISLLETQPNAKYGQTTTYSSIYSPIRRWYTLTFDSPAAYPLLPMTDNMSMGQGVVTAQDTLAMSFVDGNTTRVEDFLIYHWSQRFIKVQHSTPIGNGIDVQVQFKNDQSNGFIINNTDYILRRPLIYMKNRFVTLPDIHPGETIKINRHQNDMEHYSYQEKMAQYSVNYYNQRGLRGNFGSFIEDYLKQYYPALYISAYENLSTGILVATIEEPQLEFSILDEMVKPSGMTMLSVIFNVEHAMEGSLKIDKELWNITTSLFTDSRTVSARNARLRMQTNMPPGMTNQFRSPMINLGPNMQQRSITIGTNMNNNWDMITPIPIRKSEIVSLRIKMNYSARFMHGQMNQRVFSDGRMIESGGYITDLANGIPQDPAHELHILNRYTQEYERLSQISTGEGFIENPKRYVDLGEGKISMKMDAPIDSWMEIPREAIGIEMEVNFDAHPDTYFLGRPLLVVLEADERQMEAQNAE